MASSFTLARSATKMGRVTFLIEKLKLYKKITSSIRKDLYERVKF